MLYYKVKPEFDNCARYRFKKGSGVELDGIFIGNELYTVNELKKYLDCVNKVEPVEIPKNKTYFFFGARFGEV